MKNRKPILVITSENWSDNDYVFFEDELIIGGVIPDGWIDQKLDDIVTNNRDKPAEYCEPVPTREEIEESFKNDFFRENTAVDEFWPEHEILRAGNDYYNYNGKYLPDGKNQLEKLMEGKK